MIKIEYRYENDKCECLKLTGEKDKDKEYIAMIHRIIQHYNNIHEICDDMRALYDKEE